MSRATVVTTLLFASFIFGGLAGGPAEAAVVVSPLNCVISGATCTAVDSLGTITFSDLGNVTGGVGTDVGISIDLAGTTLRIQQVALNSDLTDGTGLTVTGASELAFSQNGISAGDCTLCFDIRVPARGGLNATDVATFTLSLGSTNLTTANFFIVNSAGLDAAVLIDNFVQGGIVWAGERPVAAPEPGSLVLLGSGLVSLSAWAWRRNRRD